MPILISAGEFSARIPGKHNRILRDFAPYFANGDAIAVSIDGDQVYARRELDFTADPSGGWRHARQRRPRDLAELGLALKLIWISIRGGRDVRERRLRLTRLFARGFDLTPMVCRRSMARFLQLDSDPVIKAAFQSDLAAHGHRRPTGRRLELSAGDTLVLTSADWRVIDAEALAKRRAAHGFKLAVALYDLLPLDYPSLLPVAEYARYRTFLADIARLADFLLATNEADARRLQDLLGTAARPRIARLIVATAALRADQGHCSARLRELGLDRAPFLLCPSTLRDRKHVAWLYHLCAKLGRDQLDFPRLVIAGRADDAHLYDVLTADPDWGRAGVFVDTPTDAELAWLYSHGAVCLHPSFEGGLGLPVTEAIGFGRRCIAADTPSLRAASNGLARHLPRDEAQWSRAIRDALAARGLPLLRPVETRPAPDVFSQIRALIAREPPMVSMPTVPVLPFPGQIEIDAAAEDVRNRRHRAGA
jgi:hypothetical protein